MTLRNVHDVRFSREAVVRMPDGTLRSAFQSHSYLARVEFDTLEQVVVVLPRHAAERPESQWIGKALEAAIDAWHVGLDVVEVTP